MYEHIGWLIAGLVLLVKGADYFVEAGARLAKKLGISDLIVGLTFVAIGTSIPELASSVAASANNAPGLITGNLLGSNIANIGLIIGIAALISPLKMKKKMYQRDGYFLILSVVLLFGLVLDGNISRWEGLIFLAVYASYMIFLIKTREEHIKKYKFRDYLDYVFNFKYVSTIRKNAWKRIISSKKNDQTIAQKKEIHLAKQGVIADVLIMTVSLIAIIYGAKYLVNEAIWVGVILELPQNIVGLSIIALGTSLPELMVSIKAAMKGMGGLIIGNVIGSNISNILLIFGISSVMNPIPLTEMSIIYTVPIMAFFSLVLLYVIRANWNISRREGALLLLCYAIFMTFAITQGVA